MISGERMNTFLASLDAGNTPFLDQVEREALETNVPIIRTQTQGLLRFLLAVRKPMSILEVGCAIGFSALLMSEKRIPVAKENFARAGKQDAITLLEGDAADILKELTGPYDFIFMDAAKGQYIHFLPEILRLLAPEGLLVSDNVLQDGDIIESRFAVERRNRTIHSRMREYLFELTHNEALRTVVLPVGDGVTVSVKVTPDGSARHSDRKTDNG